MNITVSLAGLSETKPHEYLLRFVFGGLVTALVGVITTAFGPVIGGLFLAFPSIFPATVSLVERHEARKKEEHGMTGLRLARCAAAADAAGAAMGLGQLLGARLGSRMVLVKMNSPWFT